MKIEQWLRIGYNADTHIGYDVKGDLVDYHKMVSWCEENFGETQSVRTADYRWSSHVTAWGTITMQGYFYFKSEDEGMAFKLRWL